MKHKPHLKLPFWLLIGGAVVGACIYGAIFWWLA